MKLYIAGPMTGIVNYNLPAFAAAADQLAQAGYEPVNPGSRGVVPGFTWAQYVRRGIRDGIGRHVGISTEYILRGVRGRPEITAKVRGTWRAWKRPYDERGKPMHSGKPAGFYELVEQHSPGPYLELFARRMRMGWDAWGDEAPESIAWAAS